MCSPQQGWQAESPQVQQNPIEMQGPRKTPQNRQHTTSTSSSCNVKWLDLGSIMWFKNGFSFSSDCFLSTELRKFFSQGLQLGQQKETKNSLVQQCLKMKSYPHKNLNRRRQEIKGYKSFLSAGHVIVQFPAWSCTSIHAEKNYLCWIQGTRERIYGKTALSWGYWLIFFLYPCVS